MKTKTINLYSFDELSEDAKKKAIENLYDINVDSEWWESTYDDSANVGINITGFDTGRRNDITGNLTMSMCEVCHKLIAEHGEDCETYKTAKDYLNQWDALVEKHSDGITKDKVSEYNEYDFDVEADNLEDDFRKAILEDYLIILRNEYEYLTSDEAIIETIQLNEYTFTENGKIDS